MFHIKRTKKAPVGPDGVVTTALHYAVCLAPAGNVIAWTSDIARAGTFSQDAADKTLTFYRQRTNAGVLTYEATEPKPEIKPALIVPPAAPVPKVEPKVEVKPEVKSEKPRQPGRK